MFRTVNDQPTLWDSILPPELLVLPVELGRVDAGSPWTDRSSVGTGAEKNSSDLISGRAPSAALSSTSLIASAMTFAASSSCHWRSSAGMGTAGQDRADELTAGVDTTCTGVSGYCAPLPRARPTAQQPLMTANRQPRPRLPDVLGHWTFALPPIAIGFRSALHTRPYTMPFSSTTFRVPAPAVRRHWSPTGET